MHYLRYKQVTSFLLPYVNLRVFAALRDKFKEGYRFKDFRADLMSGAVVAMVAIPLGMALAIASGVAPQHGLYTVIIAGAVVAIMGGSRFQVTGPTAAFVVILAPIAQKYGMGGLLVSGLMAGILLVILGVARLGRLIQFIPFPVTTGFTSGIAVVIASLQLKDFLGLQVPEMPERYLEKLGALFQARGSFSFLEFGIGIGTLGLLILWPKINKKIPGPLVALTAVSAVAAAVKIRYPDLEIATIGSRFSYQINGISGHGIPPSPPIFTLPWTFSGPGGKPFLLDLEMIETLMPSAFAIAMLGAIESLLSAVVADGMAHTKHDPDAELVALGAGNILCPFFGGIAATGAIARTATNIRFGARSPLSAVIHALLTLVVVLVLGKWVSYLPMAALAALLMLVAYNMSEMKHFFHIVKVAPKSDVLVLLFCFSLTVLFDMVVGVTVGVGLAALLFMRRMATVTSAQIHMEGSHPRMREPLPKNLLVYEIAGPLFFGAAEHAVEAINNITDELRGIIFYMENVPVIDVTGLVAFESAIARLQKQHQRICIVGLRAQPESVLRKSGLLRKNQIELYPTLHEAVQAFSRDPEPAQAHARAALTT